MTGPLSTAEIREKFLTFFESKEHLRLASHSTISPDATTLFTVAGMQPFKPQFMGAAASFDGKESKRVTSAQKCVRLDDIENVGRTRRHLSLFEMMGNFSFGDYFKRDAIHWAWEFLTSPQWMGMDKDRIYVTVYKDDQEAFNYWNKEIGLPADHIHRFDADENFWPANAPLGGPNGPCGPCSEIFYDRGPKYGDDSWEDYAKTCESARFLEIWNLVFPQFERQDLAADGTPVLKDLPFKNIDTGMGLERVSSVVQDVPDFYTNDVFKPIIDQIAKLSGQAYEGEQSVSHRVVAEHIRSISMVLADGTALSNTGRGYTARKVLRRASRHAYLLGLKEPTLYKLVPLVVEKMGMAYPELKTEQSRVEAAVKAEEERFLKTLESGIQRLEDNLYSHYMIEGYSGIRIIDATSEHPEKQVIEIDKRYFDIANKITAKSEQSRALTFAFVSSLGYLQPHIAYHFEAVEDSSKSDANKVISGSHAFTFYDTYGFPLDLTKEIAEEYGLSVDEEGFKKEMAKAQETARAGSKYGKSELFDGNQQALKDLPATKFVGFDCLDAQSEVVALVATEKLEHLPAGAEATVVLSSTPFYAEGGGEVGDTGRLEWDSGCGLVRDTRKTPEGVFLHDVLVEEGELKPQQQVRAIVSAERRATERHHTATHLLHAALRAVLGSGVRQAGSLVAPDRLRFDFSHNAAMTAEEIQQVERLVNRWVTANFAVSCQEMAIDEAKAAGATALFGEKYGDTVRVVKVEGNVNFDTETVSSMELCGGAHVKRTGDIGTFIILSDENVAAGVRRVEALAGEAASEWIRERLNMATQAAGLLNTSVDGLAGRITGLQNQVKAAEKETANTKRQLAEAQMGGGGGSAAQTAEIGGYKVASLKLSGIEGGELRGAADKLLDQSKADLVVLASDKGLVIKASKDAVKRGAHAGKLIGKLAAAGGGKGGGRPDMAQAGIADADAALGALEGAL